VSGNGVPFFLRLLALAVLGSPALLAERGNEAAVAYRIGNHGPWDPDTFIKTGDTPGAVRATIGAPDDRLSADVWVYWNYKSTDPRTKERGYDTLLTIFRNERVVELRVVSGEPVRLQLARLRRTTTGVADRSAASP
jgi:hypothetical protein